MSRSTSTINLLPWPLFLLKRFCTLISTLPVNRETSALSRMLQLAIRGGALDHRPVFPERLEERGPRQSLSACRRRRRAGRRSRFRDRAGGLASGSARPSRSAIGARLDAGESTRAAAEGVPAGDRSGSAGPAPEDLDFRVYIEAYTDNPVGGWVKGESMSDLPPVVVPVLMRELGS